MGFVVYMDTWLLIATLIILELSKTIPYKILIHDLKTTLFPIIMTHDAEIIPISLIKTPTPATKNHPTIGIRIYSCFNPLC